jgi:hypothetical protein
VPADRHARTDQLDSADRIEPRLAAEQTEKTEAMEPTEPIERIDPAEPMLRIDPAEPIERIDPLDPMLRIEPAEPVGPRAPPLIPMPGFSPSRRPAERLCQPVTVSRFNRGWLRWDGN